MANGHSISKSVKNDSIIDVIESISYCSNQFFQWALLLTVMSQESQFYWTHQIPKDGSNDANTFLRFSITFRTVGANYINSTVILGDSNTKHLKSSEGKSKDVGKFGYVLPGKRVETFHPRDIEPKQLLGYRNAIIHCGSNDV